MHISYLIQQSIAFYTECEYLGNIEISARLQEVLGKELIDPVRGYAKITDVIPDGPKCFDSAVLASKQCLSRDLESEEKRKNIVEELICQLLWAFNIPVDQPWVRERFRGRIR